MSKFAQLESQLAGKPGVYDPAGLTAAIGRKKLGAGAFNAKAQAGRRKASKHRPLIRTMLSGK